MFGDIGAQGRQHAVQSAWYVYIGHFCVVHQWQYVVDTYCPLGPTMRLSTPALLLCVLQAAASSENILAWSSIG